MQMPFLIGTKVYLRPLFESDAQANYPGWLNDYEVCRGNSHHKYPYALENATRFIQNSWGAKDKIILAIVLIENDLHIGNISLQNIDYLNRNAELAILVGEKSAWGTGFSKEACLLLVRHAFLELNMHRIYCGTASNNIAMQKIALALGMKKEGVRREALFKNGVYLDMLDYGILKNEFKGI